MIPYFGALYVIAADKPAIVENSLLNLKYLWQSFDYVDKTITVREQMDRKKLVAIITGAISILLAVGYLLLVQLLDFRGEMLPAPISQIPIGVEIVLRG